MPKFNPLILVFLLIASVASAQSQTKKADSGSASRNAKTGSSSKNAEDGFVALASGNSFDGWVQRGGKSTYEIKDGVVTGTCVGGEPNSFMCTEKLYGDFVLELEFKVDQAMNSGVQIRSECFDQERELELADGKKKKVPAGRVHGYQVEIDPSDRSWTGGIYDEARRGWIHNLEKNEAARKAIKQGQWNKFRIVCNGDHIQTWLNGVPAADLKDDMTSKGFIALQIHGASKKKKNMIGSTVQWRNIRIKEIAASSK